MGQVTIEIPQKVNRNYKIVDSEFGEHLLAELDQKSILSYAEGSVIPPRRHSLKADSKSVLGIWKDRPESAQEIARRLRQRNNGEQI